MFSTPQRPSAIAFLAPWFVAVALLVLATPAALADYQLNMSPGVTPISREVYGLHMIIFYLACLVGIGVFGAMAWTIYHHRKSRHPEPAQFHESTKVEVVWTVVPFFILLAMAIPATQTLIKMEDTSEASLTINVTGYQWRWRYDYIGEDVSFFSTLTTPPEQIENREAKGENYLLEVDNHVVVPVGEKIRFLTTAADVIHSWWVPALGWKRDAIPGFVNESWALIEEPGIYRGQCTELCGRYHGYMPIVLEAVSREEFDAWLAAQRGEDQGQNLALAPRDASGAIH
ncbi:MAG: cytochrome c oxidase subunit II [Candidatus Competibacterales bacterium]